MTTVIVTLNTEDLYSGFLPVTKIDEEGRRTGKMPVVEVAKLFKGVAQMELESREVRLISRFRNDGLLGIGNNGDRWVAVKEIPPAEYFLTTVTGSAFKVNLPRLVARVANHGSSHLFWTEDEVLTSDSLVYPLIIGNISDSGWICLGTTGLKCKALGDIDRFIRQAVEAPSTGTYLPAGTEVDKFYQSLTERWDKSIGSKNGITLERLIAKTD